MQGQQVQISLKAPVDTSTYDLINNDTIYSDKNSIVYKGVLSNITSTTGSGTLSTTGKSITVDGDEVTIGDTSLDFSGSVKVTGSSISSDYEVIDANYNNGTLYYVERLSDTKLRFHSGDTSTYYEASYDNTYYVSGAVSSNGIFFFAEYRYEEGNGYLVTVRTSEENTYTTQVCEAEYGTDRFTVWYNSDTVFAFGFESYDMRKRCICYMSNNTFKYFRGIGLLDNEGNAYGEPVPYWTVDSADAIVTTYETASTDTLTCTDTTAYTLSDKGFTELENGSLSVDLIESSAVEMNDSTWYPYHSNAAGGFVSYTPPTFTESATETGTKNIQHLRDRDLHNGVNYFGQKGFFPEIPWNVVDYTSSPSSFAPAFFSDYSSDADGYIYALGNKAISLEITYTSTNVILWNTSITSNDFDSGWTQNCLDALIATAGRGSIGGTTVLFDTLEYTKADTTINWTALNTSNNIISGTIAKTDNTSISVYEFYQFPFSISTGDTVAKHMSFTQGEALYLLSGNNLAETQADGTTKDTTYHCVFNYNTFIGNISGWGEGVITTSTSYNKRYCSNHLSYVDRVQATTDGLILHCTHMQDYSKWGDSRRMTPKYQLEYNEGIGLEEPTDYEQTFGHTRIFCNRLYNKGLYWDYGRGWSKFNLAGYGYDKTLFWEPCVITTPLTDNEGNIWDSLKSGELDLSNGWPLVVDDGETTTSLPDCTILYNNVRYHPLTEDNMSEDISINHNFSGSTSSYMSLTTKFNVTDDIILQVWSGVPMSFTVNKSLIWSPQDLGSDFNYYSNDGDGFIVKWSKNNVYYAVFGTDVELNVQKIADYMFGVNATGVNNLIVETYTGSITVERYAIPYTMNVTVVTTDDFLLPADGDDGVSNDVYYYGSGYNVFQNDEKRSTSVLIPSYTLQTYVNSDDLDSYNNDINNRKGLLLADIGWCMLASEDVDEFYTHTLLTTDITYKNTRYVSRLGNVEDRYNESLADTSWWFNEDVTLYPIGLCTTIYGENYISPTVDGGNGYVARLYTSDNKLFTSFNTANLVYQGSEIFTIMTSNYYFDGKSIYYLGNQSDYSQNVFTAYALGMKLLANSSSEAYFYSAWDKCIYLFTASTTLQKSTSLSGMGEILDAAYSSHEQTLYVLFDDGKLWCKTQDDSMIIETGITDGSLETINEGCIIVSNGSYTMYSPYKYNNIENLKLTTEWLGNVDGVQAYPYLDIVLYDDTMETEPNLSITISCMDSGEIKDDVKNFSVKKSYWKNNFYRLRVTPKELTGQAFKLSIESSDLVKIQSISVRVVQSGDVPSVSFTGRK